MIMITNFDVIKTPWCIESRRTNHFTLRIRNQSDVLEVAYNSIRTSNIEKAVAAAPSYGRTWQREKFVPSWLSHTSIDNRSQLVYILPVRRLLGDGRAKLSLNCQANWSLTTYQMSVQSIQLFPRYGKGHPRAHVQMYPIPGLCKLPS